MLFRKIEVSSSPDKPKLRSDYLKMVFDRWYFYLLNS